MLQTQAQHAGTFSFVSLFPGLTPYDKGLQLQREAVERIEHGEDRGTVLMLEHEAVYTAGRRASEDEYPTDGTPVVPVDRGGKVTWHGPGQLVVYPIVRLKNPLGVVDFVRQLESALIDIAAEFGVQGMRVEGRTGLWADTGGLAPSKFAQIGLRARRGIITHGIALNCCNDLAPFGSFIPCGITDAGVTTLSKLAGRTITPEDTLHTVTERFTTLLEEAAE